jgi:hypothetical protein
LSKAQHKQTHFFLKFKKKKKQANIQTNKQAKEQTNKQANEQQLSLPSG